MSYSARKAHVAKNTKDADNQMLDRVQEYYLMMDNLYLLDFIKSPRHRTALYLIGSI